MNQAFPTCICGFPTRVYSPMAHKDRGRSGMKRPLDMRIKDYIEHMKFFMVLCSNALRSHLGNSVHGCPPPEATSP